MSATPVARPTTSERARRYVAQIPGAVSGAGGHNQTFAVACSLVHGFALNESEALDLLREYNLRCSPPWSERELLHKVQSAAAAAHDKPLGHLLGDSVVQPYSLPAARDKAVTAKLDPATAVENFLKGFRCSPADLIAASTCKIPPLICGPHFHRQGAYLIDQLFEPGELVNVVLRSAEGDGKARPADSGLTLERNEWEARLMEPITVQSGGAWLRMNPLDGRGVGDANVTAFRFALIEIDSVPMDLQIPLLARLPLPIAAIITSGGKSAHAWVRSDASDCGKYRDTVTRMLEALARFGVDGKNKNPSRLSRLPGVVRTSGAVGDGKQQLLYLNPQPKQQPIL
jgi:hypothetical protein